MISIFLCTSQPFHSDTTLYLDINLSYSHKRIFTSRDNLDLTKYEFEKKIVIVSNNFLIPETIKSKNLLSFDNNVKLQEADIIILSKKLISFGDKVCTELEECLEMNIILK